MRMHPAARPLADTLVRRVFRAYIGLAVLITGLQMWGLYRYEQMTTQRELGTIAKALEPSVSEALWNFQEPILQSLANGALENDLVSAIVITDAARTIRVEAPLGRSVPGTPSVRRELSLPQAAGSEEALGVIELHANRAAVMSRIYRSFASLLGGALIKAVGLWMIIVFLARRLITRPITRFTESLRTVDIAAGTPPARETNDCVELEALHDAFGELMQRAGAAQRLQEEKLAAEARSAEHARFLASASHDLRQPLHALSLYLAALSRNTLASANAELVHKAQACAQLVDGMFRSILDLSRLEAGASAPRVQVFALQDILDAVRIQHEPAAQAKGLALRIADTRLLCCSDPALVARIVHNLVSNAVRYTTHGGVLVGCRRAGRLVRIEVHDTGPGIAEATRRVVFADYGRATPSHATEGAGLGLAIARRLTELLGHSLALRSQPGRGSSFSLSVPLASAGETSPLPDRHGASQDARALAGKLIFIIDDEPAITEATSRLVESWGAIPLVASSYDEAIQMAETPGFEPDVMLCDFQLADDRNGNMLIAALRQRFVRHVPALLVTGARLPDDAMPLEAHVLYKPVADDTLYSALVALLGRIASPGPDSLR